MNSPAVTLPVNEANAGCFGTDPKAILSATVDVRFVFQQIRKGPVAAVVTFPPALSISAVQFDGA